MSRLFDPPSAEWTPISPALVRVRRILVCVWWLVVVIALGVIGLLLPTPDWVWLLGVIIAVIALVWAWFVSVRNARSWRYAELDDELWIKHGIMFKAMVAVPYGRMQYVDVHAGPLDQLFSIASVHLHTAAPGTSARIPGLPAAEATRLRDKLTQLGETQAAGL